MPTPFSSQWRQVDTRKTIKQLDPTDTASTTFEFVVRGIGELLAFDAGAAFSEANKTTGKQDPWEGLTVVAMQALARKAYFAGTDVLPPVVPKGATFTTTNFSIAVPAQPAKWLVVRCEHDHIVFRSQDAFSYNVYTASVGDIRLEPFTSEERFLRQIRAEIASQAPAGHRVAAADVTMLSRPGPPCAAATAEFSVSESPAQRSHDFRYLLYARFCYVAKQPYLGYSALLSYQGRTAPAEIRDIAMSYFDGVKTMP